MKVTVCDKCGEDIANEYSYNSEKNITTLKISYYEHNDKNVGLNSEYTHFEDSYDLCPTCAQEVRELVENNVDYNKEK